MAPEYGGELPLAYQDSRLTVEPPDGVSADAPVNQGDVFELDPTAGDAEGSGYKLIEATAGDDPTEAILCVALSRVTSVKQHVGVLWLSGAVGRVSRLPYVGTAPTLGQSIVVAPDVGGDPARAFTGQAWKHGSGTIVKVDTVNSVIEVLF